MDDKLNGFADKIIGLTKDGVTMDEVMAALTSALDDMEKLKAQKVKSAAAQEREICVKNIEQDFHDHYQHESLNLSDVSSLAVLCCEKDYPDWTKKDIMDFKETVEEVIKLAAKNQGKTPADMMKDLLEDMRKDFSMHIPKHPFVLKSDNPAFDGQKAKVVGWKEAPKDADEEAIKAFLDSLK